jgi:thioredoxin reductase (NADPH)
MTHDHTIADLAIVGAGPIGIELAVAAQRAGLRTLHFEAGQIGQTILGFPRQMQFFSSSDRIAIAGVPIASADQTKCTREQYLAYLRMVCQQFALDIHTFEPVTAIEREGDAFRIATRPAAGAAEYRARHVAFATGDTHLPNLLGIEGEDLPHVSHHFVEPHEYFLRKLLVVGGKNSAVEAALRCYHAGAHVTLSYRGDRFDDRSVKYWLLPELKGRIKRDEIACHLRTRLLRITPTHVTLENLDTGETFDQRADAVLLMTGYRADMSLLRSAGVELTGAREQPVYGEQTMQTNVPGLYVAGTAIAGTQQSYQVFLENCHIHVDRIVAHITGAQPPTAAAGYDQQET